MDVREEIIGLSPGEELKLLPNIKIFGIGGAGCNMVDWLYKIGIQGAELIAANTDLSHLKIVKAHKKLLLGKDVTKGLGAGGIPEKGAEATNATSQEIKRLLEGTDMLWILLGLGGGTGTGGAPIVAKIAKEMGIPLVIAVATLPFKSEGVVRREKAEQGLLELRKYCDNVILIDNNKILEYAGNLPLQQAFGYANNIIAQMIKGIVEAIQIKDPSNTEFIMNLDFADVKTVLSVGGSASIVGIGESSSEMRAKEAAKRALELPLLEVDYKGAQGALVYIEGGEDMTLGEVHEAWEYVQQYLGPDAMTKVGARVVKGMKGKIRVTVIISGVKSPYVLSRKEDKNSVSVTFNKELGIDLITV